jgi:ribonuclease HI
MSLTNKAVIVYTDGSSRGNPGPGGYGVLLIWGNTTKELSQGYRCTTNNRMELMAVIAALQAIKKDDQHLIIHSDSSYVVKAIEEGWLKNWIKINFKDKKNKDLWMLYHQLSQKHHVKLKWVKGHAENIYNNRCDELATEAADGKNLLIDEGYENG